MRWPGKIEAGAQNDNLQSLVDLAPTFLSAAEQNIPVSMQGINQLDAWHGKKSVRSEVLVEFQHQPTKINMRTYIDEQWKLTVYLDHDYGEIFDLKNDPDERQNLWDDINKQDIKRDLLGA